MELNQIVEGNALEVLKSMPDEFVDCIITSPPYYGLRDYGVDGQLGLEKTLEEFLLSMLKITAECKRVLKKTGTMWWNHGDSYANRNPMKRGGRNLHRGRGAREPPTELMSRIFRKNPF